jgi:hypothetical protein
MSDLDKRVKEPIYIYEGYFHSMNTSDTIYSKNPNPLLGYDFMKPAAHQLLRAYYHTFRQINYNIFYTLYKQLIDNANISSDNINDRCYICIIFADWIIKDKIFGDLSIQIHYGKGNEETFRNAWHVDAENSLLHFATTIRGYRVLHSRRCDVVDCNSPTEKLEIQKEQNIYLTSSALMMHAPQFFNTTYENRVIAIHARILYTSNEINEFRKMRNEQSWQKLTSIISNILSKADLKIPTLQQIENNLLVIP